MPTVLVDSLDREARGVARAEGKALFIEGALPGELVEYQVHRKKPSYELASALRIRREASTRVAPRCKFFDVCGGCSMQHLHTNAQVAVKQRVLEDALLHIGRVKPESMLRPIYGHAWRYRRRARFSVRFVQKKGGVLVGFRERKSSFVVDMTSCEVLPTHVSDLIVPLRELVARLSIADRLPQIEVAVGERLTVLVLRILAPLDERDCERLRAFSAQHAVQLWLQPKGPDSAAPFYPLDAPALDYSLSAFGLRMSFRPTDFTQVNHSVNELLVQRALDLLDPQPDQNVADLFCGLGNFTLAIARSGAKVIGYEGQAGLVSRARENALANGLSVEFRAVNLFKPDELPELRRFDSLLIDPPREGAIEVMKRIDVDAAPRRVVYVSCDPATMARDAAILVSSKGYRLAAAGIVNMFPQTSHVESIAQFIRP